MGQGKAWYVLEGSPDRNMPSRVLWGKARDILEGTPDKDTGDDILEGTPDTDTGDDLLEGTWGRGRDVATVRF